MEWGVTMGVGLVSTSDFTRIRTGAGALDIARVGCAVYPLQDVTCYDRVLIYFVETKSWERFLIVYTIADFFAIDPIPLL